MKKHFLTLLILTSLYSCNLGTKNTPPVENKAELIQTLQLNNFLREISVDMQNRSRSLITALSEKVRERGNKHAEVHALNEGNNLHAMSKDVISYIEELKQEMITKSGGYFSDGLTPFGLANSTISNTTFFKDNNEPTDAGKKFIKDLDNYISNLNSIYFEIDKATGSRFPEKNHYKSITLDGKEDPTYMGNMAYIKKSFLELSFQNRTLASALAFLTQIQTRVVMYEKENLAKLQEMVGASDFKFDMIIPIVVPESKTVSVGETYKAEIFISAMSSSIKPKMSFNGKPIEVNYNGAGEIEIKAKIPTSAKPDEKGRYLVSTVAEIAMPSPIGGDDVIMEVPINYYVKP